MNDEARSEFVDFLTSEIKGFVRGLYLDLAEGLDRAAEEADRGAVAAFVSNQAQPPEWFKGYAEACRTAAIVARMKADAAVSPPSNVTPIRGAGRNGG